MQNVVWQPPVLRFIMERHGATVLGSTKAEIQEWNINLEKGIADCWNAGYKQVVARQSRLNVRPLAEEIVFLILAHKEDERLRWLKDGSVWVQIGKILPQASAVKQTLAGRRSRFRQAVGELLCNAGWRTVRSNVYAPPAT
jgi:hypothetical protein